MIRVSRETLGALRCRLVHDEGRDVRLGVVLCHGFGAPGTDLVPLGREFLQTWPQLGEGTLFVFPEAPLSMEDYGLPFGRAWWPLDMTRLQAAVERGEFRDLRNDRPELLPAAGQRLGETIAAVQERFGLPWARLVLGGFSQGGMLATDVTLRSSESPAALVIWSGTLLNEAEWRSLAGTGARVGLRVFHSHGRQDPLLPFEAAGWLRDLLTEGGLDVDFVPFEGGHTIPAGVLRQTGEWLQVIAGAC
jgi:phospholipase/carboxylesterase